MGKFTIGIASTEYFDIKTISNNVITLSSAHGGFGFLTRLKAEYLAKLGHEVHVFIPAVNYDRNLNETKTIERNKVLIHLIRVNPAYTGAITKYSYYIKNVFGVIPVSKDFIQLIRDYKVELVHFEDTPIDFMNGLPSSIPSLLVFQDPWDYTDIKLLHISNLDFIKLSETGQIAFSYDSPKISMLNRALVKHYVTYIAPLRHIFRKRRNMKLFAEADFIGVKAYSLFKLKYVPPTLRNPIIIRDTPIKKSSEPTVVWIARWDPQKRPDMVYLIARRMPGVQFYVIGKPTENCGICVDAEPILMKKFQELPNMHILGATTEEEKRDLLNRAWVFLNTSIREGLPMTFLEAYAEGTPIVSFVDPDNYVSNFGIKVKKYDVNSFVNALKEAIDNELYKDVMVKAREFVINNHEISKIMEKHLQIYEELLSVF